MALLIHLTNNDEASWAAGFRNTLPKGTSVFLRGDAYDPADIDYICVWKPGSDAFDGLSNLKAILSFGAGVDALLNHPKLPKDVPIVRFVDGDLTQRMTDYVVAHVSMHQRLYSRFQADQKARRWVQLYPVGATQSTVGIMGLGVLGQDAAKRLIMLGYNVRGWSRSEKVMEGAQTFAGTETFDEFLTGTDILVNLLPLTADTKGILNYETFTRLRRGTLDGGPVIINAARGGHQNERDIFRALNDGTLGAASLDVFEVEPLPEDSPLWAVENCYITPHIAAASSEKTGVVYFSKIMMDHAEGKALPNVVDITRGY